MNEATTDLIELGDIDELIRFVDSLCSSRDWPELLRLRDLCRKAGDRGKQLGSVASHAEYRVALEADGEYAAQVLVPGAGQFALGPLAEVAASLHTYEELSPWLEPSPISAFFAHECIVKGADLHNYSNIDNSVLELPLKLQPWEPFYALAKYEAHQAFFPSPFLPDAGEIKLPPPSRYKPIDDIESTNALRDLVGAWTRESNGHCDVSVVNGGPAEAIASLGLKRASIAPLNLDETLGQFAWAGANGGAHGARRGMATGRFSAWWTLAALCGVARYWPLPANELYDYATELKFWHFTTAEPTTGWNLRIAIHHPGTDVAWVIRASDTAE